MPSELGAVARALEPIVRWLFAAEGYAAWRHRRQLRALQQAARAALAARDWARLRELVAELERLSRAP